MKKNIPILLTIFLFISCGRPLVSYVGTSYQVVENANIDVYVDPGSVNRSYTVIGKGYLNRAVGGPYTRYEKVQRAAIEQARKHGADAVLITDRYYVQAAVQTTNQYDTAGRRINSSTVSGPVMQNDMEIQFLKYK